MEVHIKTFRMTSNYKIFLEKGKLTLIKGDSGAGKTTILEAITWCLFGTLRGVDDPVSGQKAKVIIKSDDHKIIRSKVNCVSVEVYYKGNKYTSKAAEAIIEELYISKDLWYLCSYFPQNGMLPFLYTMSSKERLNTLHKIAFTDADPRKEIEACHKGLINFKEVKEIQTLKYDKAKRRYKRFKKKIDITLACSEEELDKKKETMESIISSIKDLKKQRDINNNNKLKISLLQENIDKSTNKINDLTSKLDIIPDNVTNIKDLIKYRKIFDTIQINNKVLDEIPIYDVTFDNKYLYDNEEREKIYNKNLDLCKSLSIDYNKDTIDECIKEVERKIELKKLQKKIKEKIKLNQTVSSYDLNVFTDDLLIETINSENIIKSNKAILSKYNIEYNEDSIESEIDNIRKNLDHQDIILQIEKRNNILKKIDEIPNITPFEVSFTNDDYLGALDVEKKIQDNISIAKKIPISYDKDEINRSINYINKNLSNQDTIIKIEKRNSILKKIEDLSEISKPEHLFTEEDLFNTIKKEKEVEANKKEYDNLKIEYKKDSVEKEIRNIKETLDYQDTLLQVEKRNNIIQKLKEIPIIEPSEHKFTKQQLETVTKEEDIYERNKALCDQYSIEYTNENVRYIVANYKIIKLYNKRCKYTYCTPKEYEEQRSKLKKLQDGLKCVRCPNCSTSLIHQNGKLKASSVSISTKEQVDECKEILSKMEEYINLSKDIPDEFHPKPFVKHLSDKELDILSSLEYVDKPKYSGKYIKKQIENQEKYEKTKEERKKYKEKLSKLQEVSLPEGLEIKKLSMLEKKNYSDRLVLLSKLKYTEDPEFSSKYIRQQINNAKKYQIKEKQIRKLSEIPKIDVELDSDIKKLSDKEKKEYEQKLSLLTSISYIDPPKFSSSFIKQELHNNEQYIKNKKLLQEYQDKLKKIPSYEIPKGIKVRKLSDKEKKEYKEKLDVLTKITYVKEPLYSSSIIKDIISTKRKLELYKDIPDELPSKLYSKDIYNEYNKIKSINYVDKPTYYSSYIKEVIENTDKRNNIIKIIEKNTKDISKFTVTTELPLEELKKIKVKLNNNSKINSFIEQERKYIIQNKEEIDSIKIDDTIEDELEKHNEKLDEIKEDIDRTEKANKLVRYKEEYDKYKDNLQKVNKKIEGMTILKELLVSSEKEVLNNVIANINNTIKPIVSKMFDLPISVVFSLTKTLKNGNEKDQLSVTISYKSVVFDSVSSLSGGEQVRVSMSFLLAIAEILNVRLILLDEPCKSLNDSIIENCVKVIKKTTKATKLCIAHNEIEARYDNSVLVE